MEKTAKAAFSQGEISLFWAHVPDSVLVGNIFGLDVNYPGLKAGA